MTGWKTIKKIFMILPTLNQLVSRIQVLEFSLIMDFILYSQYEKRRYETTYLSQSYHGNDSTADEISSKILRERVCFVLQGIHNCQEYKLGLDNSLSPPPPTELMLHDAFIQNTFRRLHPLVLVLAASTPTTWKDESNIFLE